MSGPHLRTKPKFIRLYTMLGISPQTARGLLEFLWDSVHDTGNAEIGDADAIEAAAGWTGEPGKLAQALLNCGGLGKRGFIEEVPDQSGIYQLHDLLEHTPADRQRQWMRQQERLERGSTIKQVRTAAANARWAKERANKGADVSSDAIAVPPAAVDDANRCKPLQTGAVCMPAKTCNDPIEACKPVPDLPVPQLPAPDFPAFAPLPALPSSVRTIVPTCDQVYKHFQRLDFCGDVYDFLWQFQAAVAVPNSEALRRGWEFEATRYVYEKQAQAARENPENDMLRLGGKKLEKRAQV